MAADLPLMAAGTARTRRRAHLCGSRLDRFFERWTYNRHGLTSEAVDGYVRAFSRTGALRASLDDYRAIEQDTALDDVDAAEGRRLTTPPARR